MNDLNYKIRLSNWSESPIIISSSEWNIVYSLENIDAIFCGAIFRLNTNKMLFRLVVNNKNAIDVDLSKLINDYKLLNETNSIDSKSDGKFNFDWPLFCYNPKRWCLKPGEMSVETNIKIQLKSISGDKKVYCGMSWWRLQNV